ncbi:MAG: hypothetical protein LBR60_09015 [Fibrobacter sp.]|jgi:hypothetical protein|nr:hypothetical protein [Fibrobacter sp.]
MKKCFSILAILFCVSWIQAEEKPAWTWEWGISAGKPLPLSLLGGVRYEYFYLRGEGMGYRQASNDFWCGGRASLGVALFKELPYRLELGLSAGYSYAEAPNDLHDSFNEANGNYFLYDHNREETGDISAEIGALFFGFHVRLEIPVYYFIGNKKPNLLWRAGYLWEF